MPDCSGVTTRIVHAVRSRSSRVTGANPRHLSQCLSRSLFGVISLRPPPRCWGATLGIVASNYIRGCGEGPEEDEGWRAPGPDGRKLSEVKAILADELAGHFNLWLLAGCLPGRLCRGQTVLLPKCAEAEDPAKYRPITMSDIVVRCFHRILA